MAFIGIAVAIEELIDLCDVIVSLGCYIHPFDLHDLCSCVHHVHLGVVLCFLFHRHDLYGSGWIHLFLFVRIAIDVLGYRLVASDWSHHQVIHKIVVTSYHQCLELLQDRLGNAIQVLLCFQKFICKGLRFIWCNFDAFHLFRSWDLLLLARSQPSMVWS